MAGEAFADHLDHVRGLFGEAGGGDCVPIHRGSVERRQIDGRRYVVCRDTVESLRDGHRFAAFYGFDGGKQFRESVVSV